MGYIPDWQRQSAAKNQSQSKPTTTPSRIISKPIFHAEKALHSQGTQTPFTRHYADGPEGTVGSPEDNAAQAEKYNQSDKGMFGGEIKYRQDDDGRKFVQTKDPMTGRANGENRYYSVDDVKQGFKNLFSGKSKPTETLSSPTTSGTDDAEKSANKGSPAKTAMQTANDSFESSPTKGAFSNVDAAVKSATKVSDDTGITSRTDYSTKTRSNSASAPARRPAGRKDISGSEAVSYPLDDGKPASIGNQSFYDPRPSKPYPIKSQENEARSSRTAPLPDLAKEASDAGVKFAALTNHVKNLPAGTSPADRAKAGQLMRDAQTDYETKSARIKRS